jgi:hypothetical protein
MSASGRVARESHAYIAYRYLLRIHRKFRIELYTVYCGLE